MRLVSGTKYADLQHRYQRMAESRQAAEKLAAERLSTITRQAAEISRLRDEHPTSPAHEPLPLSGDDELRRQLALAQRALRDTAARLAETQTANEALSRELYERALGEAS